MVKVKRLNFFFYKSRIYNIIKIIYKYILSPLSSFAAFWHQIVAIKLLDDGRHFELHSIVCATI